MKKYIKKTTLLMCTTCLVGANLLVAADEQQVVVAGGGARGASGASLVERNREEQLISVNQQGAAALGIVSHGAAEHKDQLGRASELSSFSTLGNEDELQGGAHVLFARRNIANDSKEYTTNRRQRTHQFQSLDESTRYENVINIILDRGIEIYATGNLRYPGIRDFNNALRKLQDGQTFHMLGMLAETLRRNDRTYAEDSINEALRTLPKLLRYAFYLYGSEGFSEQLTEDITPIINDLNSIEADCEDFLQSFNLTDEVPMQDEFTENKFGLDGILATESQYDLVQLKCVLDMMKDGFSQISSVSDRIVSFTDGIEHLRRHHNAHQAEEVFDRLTTFHETFSGHKESAERLHMFSVYANEKFRPFSNTITHINKLFTVIEAYFENFSILQFHDRVEKSLSEPRIQDGDRYAAIADDNDGALVPHASSSSALVQKSSAERYFPTYAGGGTDKLDGLKEAADVAHAKLSDESSATFASSIIGDLQKFTREANEFLKANPFEMWDIEEIEV